MLFNRQETMAQGCARKCGGPWRPRALAVKLLLMDKKCLYVKKKCK